MNSTAIIVEMKCYNYYSFVTSMMKTQCAAVILVEPVVQPTPHIRN